MTEHRSDEDLIAECTAVLEGHFCELLGVRGAPRPAWAWLNLPAHGDRDDLLSFLVDLPEPPSASWQAVRAEVCIAVLGRAADDRALLDLQRAVLVPLELELIGDHSVRDPHQLLSLVRSRLAPADGTSPRSTWV